MSTQSRTQNRVSLDSLNHYSFVSYYERLFPRSVAHLSESTCTCARVRACVCARVRGIKIALLTQFCNHLLILRSWHYLLEYGVKLRPLAVKSNES